MKLKSLKNYCLDLQFRKPPAQQVAGKMMSVAFKEGIKIDMPTMVNIVEGAGCDIRQILNNLFLWSRDSVDIGWNKGQASSKETKKDVSLTPWEFVPQFFQSGHSIDHLLDCFFYDYSSAPLWVSENYIYSSKRGANPVSTMQAFSRAADSICDGDLMERHMYENMGFSALPLLGMLACVRPAFQVRGGLGPIQFSAWFGNNSREGKMKRLLSDLQLHTRMVVSADARDMRLSFLPGFRAAMVAALGEASAELGPQAAVDLLNAYDLTREDWDSVQVRIV